MRETLVQHWREILLVAGTRIAENAVFYVFTTSVILVATHEPASSG